MTTQKAVRPDLAVTETGNVKPGCIVLQPMTEKAERWMESNVLPGTWMKTFHGVLIEKERIEDAMRMVRNTTLRVACRREGGESVSHRRHVGRD